MNYEKIFIDFLKKVNYNSTMKKSILYILATIVAGSVGCELYSSLPDQNEVCDYSLPQPSDERHVCNTDCCTWMMTDLYYDYSCTHTWCMLADECGWELADVDCWYH
jgi:hypothetical protein